MVKFLSLWEVRMRYLMPMILLAAACDQPNNNGSEPEPNNDFNNFDPENPDGSSTYPYNGENPAYVTVVAELGGVAVPNCKPVLYDGDPIAVDEQCGEPIAVAPGLLLVTVGNLNNPCEGNCYAPDQFGGEFYDLPFQTLADRGKSVGVPQIVELAPGDELTLVVRLNQYVENAWSCDVSNIQGRVDGQAVFTGIDQMSLNLIGQLTVNGRTAGAEYGAMSTWGEFEDSFHFNGSSVGGEAGDFDFACSAE